MNSGLTGLTFSPLGDRALLLELGGRADPLTVSRVRALAEYLGQQQLPGVLDLVPALCSLGVHYDPETWRDDTGKHSPYENLVQKIQDVLPDPDSLAVTDGHLYEVPVCYDGEYGEDLPSLARAHNLATEQVVELRIPGPQHIRAQLKQRLERLGQNRNYIVQVNIRHPSLP